MESSLAFLMSPTGALGEAHLTRTWILYSSDLDLCSPTALMDLIVPRYLSSHVYQTPKNHKLLGSQFVQSP